jgi:hypothetical protein
MLSKQLDGGRIHVSMWAAGNANESHRRFMLVVHETSWKSHGSCSGYDFTQLRTPWATVELSSVPQIVLYLILDGGSWSDGL